MCQTEIMRNVMMLLICASLFAQQQPPIDATRADRSDVIRTSVNVVIAPTTVRDRSGNFVNPNISERQKEIDHTHRCIELACQMGIPSMRLNSLMLFGKSSR
jgi:sugar phosphate isomerase/epimerase